MGSGWRGPLCRPSEALAQVLVKNRNFSFRARYTLTVLELEQLEEALETLGELLQERGQSIGVLVVGGGSLLLLGLVQRPTADIDVVGFSATVGYTKAEVLPEFLASAVRDVGDALGLGTRGSIAVPPA